MAYGAKYRSEYLEAEAVREEQEREWARQNEAARAQRRAKSDAETTARRAALEEQVEASLVPNRTRLCRTWLAEHPGKTEADFNRHAWPQLRLNVLEEREAAAKEAETARLLRSGRYTF